MSARHACIGALHMARGKVVGEPLVRTGRRPLCGLGAPKQAVQEGEWEEVTITAPLLWALMAEVLLAKVLGVAGAAKGVTNMCLCGMQEKA